MCLETENLRMIFSEKVNAYEGKKINFCFARKVMKKRYCWRKCVAKSNKLNEEKLWKRKL